MHAYATYTDNTRNNHTGTIHKPPLPYVYTKKAL